MKCLCLQNFILLVRIVYFLEFESVSVTRESNSKKLILSSDSSSKYDSDTDSNSNFDSHRSDTVSDSDISSDFFLAHTSILTQVDCKYELIHFDSDSLIHTSI